MKDELRVANKLFLTHLWVCVDSTELPFCKIVLQKLRRVVQIIKKTVHLDHFISLSHNATIVRHFHGNII